MHFIKSAFKYYTGAQEISFDKWDQSIKLSKCAVFNTTLKNNTPWNQFCFPWHGPQEVGHRK